ncbi:MAG: hypothetical protein HYV90_01445 [Candidatus Woesebacteria bacterium]|nr:MAG: hypothetical protein HYV90_01445 [Candidatus Woesebacteria bacterium]
MIFAASLLLFLVIFTLSVTDAKAIVVLIPVVLIPIVNVVVWVIGAIATPVVGLTALYFKIKKKSPVIGILLGVVLLLLLGLIITIVFKIINPERPIY